ncbi:MAG TPA: winged helix-turn-helix transcriptional regulator [Thermoanaerobaculia bacterium]|jgi:DNA-binding HxlR family transcriptional regulator|nr:winged helix-turn-helix transcriptional regulator [Thermoanaerobaculia bacterium]
MTTSKRTYEDGCATAHALDLIGERWALLVVRELILGPKRFTDLRAGLPGISPNVLTQRLEELENGGILRRRKLAPPAAAWVYELTEWGRDLEQVIMTLGRWGARSPSLMQGYPLSVDAVILSFRTMFRGESAREFKGTLELRIGEDRFRARVVKGALELVRGAADDPDAVLETDAGALVALAYGGRKLNDALKAGEVKVEGDKGVVRQFFTLFPLPATVGE